MRENPAHETQNTVHEFNFAIIKKTRVARLYLRTSTIERGQSGGESPKNAHTHKIKPDTHRIVNYNVRYLLANARSRSLSDLSSGLRGADC